MAVINNNYLKGMAFRRKDCFDSFGVPVEDEIESVSYVGPKASNEFSDVAAKIIRIRELFIKKIVKSNNFNIYTLDFDIKKGRKILWDLLVLSEIVKYEINNMGPEAVLAFEESLERKKLYTETSKKEAVRINSFDAKNLKSLQTADGIQMTSEDIVQYLLDAVCILDSLRNSFGHNNAGQKCYLNKDRVFIKNDDPKNTLDFSMDFIYLAEFGTGIVVKEEHSHILKRVNAVYLHLCDYLNFRSRDTITLLDRMTSRNLKILLKYVNNDFTKLLDLPDILFSANLTEERFYALERLIGIDNFKYVPTYVVDYDFDLKKLETLIKIVGNDVKNLSHLPVALFFQPFDLKKVNALIDLVGGYKNLKYLPASMFAARCSKELFDLLEDFIGDSKDEELINKLKKFKKDVPTNLLVKKGATNLIFKILAEKKRFNGEGEITFEDFHRFSNLFSFFADERKIKFLIEYTYDPTSGKYNLDLLNKVDPEIYKIGCSIKKIKMLLGDATSLEVLKDLKKQVFSIDCVDQKVNLLLCNSNNPDPNERAKERLYVLQNLSSTALSASCTVDYLEFLLTEGYTKKEKHDPKFLLTLPPAIFHKACDIFKLRTLMGVNFSDSNETFIDSLNRLSDLPLEAFSAQLTIQDIWRYRRLGVDIKKLPTGMFIYDVCFDNLKFIYNCQDISDEKFLSEYVRKPYILESLNKLPKIIFSKRTDPNIIRVYMGENHDVTNLYGIIDHYFTREVGMDRVKFLIECGYFDKFKNPAYDKLFSNICISKCTLSRAKILFGDRLENLCLDFIPPVYFSDSISDASVRRILEYVGGTKNLKKLPRNLFFNNNDFDKDIVKTMYGATDDQMLSLILYMNSVFSAYHNTEFKPEDVDTSKINIYKNTENPNLQVYEKFDGIIKGRYNSSGVLAKSGVIHALSTYDGLERYFIENKFDFFSQFKTSSNFDALSAEDLLTKYEKWVQNISPNIIIRNHNKAIFSTLRNVADHVHFTDIGSNKIGMTDTVVLRDQTTGQVGGNPTVTAYFTADRRDLFDVVREIDDHCFRNDTSKLSYDCVKEILGDALTHAGFIAENDHSKIDYYWNNYLHNFNIYMNKVNEYVKYLISMKKSSKISLVGLDLRNNKRDVILQETAAVSPQTLSLIALSSYCNTNGINDASVSQQCDEILSRRR